MSVDKENKKRAEESLDVARQDLEKAAIYLSGFYMDKHPGENTGSFEYQEKRRKYVTGRIEKMIKGLRL